LRLSSTVVVADNKAVLRSKLRQICGGHVIGEDIKTGKPSQELLETDKIPQLEHLISQLPNAIIYTEFDKDMDLVADALIKAGKSFSCVRGKSTQADKAIQSFKDGKIDFLLMQSKSGNAGLDLTCTNNMIFYTLPESFIVFSQCKARIQRLGQTKECNYYYLLCKNTVDEDIYYNALSKKKSYSDKLFNSYSK
jgi:SNF2 family DNA or RNA helicase